MKTLQEWFAVPDDETIVKLWLMDRGLVAIEREAGSYTMVYDSSSDIYRAHPAKSGLGFGPANGGQQ